MSRSTRDWSTPVLALSAQILRTVTPNTLGSLVLVSNGTATTQTAIADTINRDQSTVSTYFQSLTIETADLALIERPNQCYSVTETGEAVIELVADLSDIDVASIDWGSAAEKEQIGTLLAPLYTSRSVAPFFVLNSLRNRSGTPRSVSIDDVVRDVENRVQEMDETTSKKRIDQIIERFVSQNAITIDDDCLTLRKKGKKDAHLLHQLAPIVDRQVTSNTDGSGASSSIDLSKVADQMRRDRIATAWSLETADEQLIDESHFYPTLKRLDVLDTPHNEWNSLRWLTIENVGTEPTTAIFHKESGENKITHKDMDLAVFLDGPDGQRLKVKDLVDQQPAFEQKMKILFPQPLPPGETLTLHYRMSWPNELAFYSGELTQSIALTRYTHGVGELQFGVIDTVDHAGVDCQKLVDDSDQLWRRVSATPESVVADQRPTLTPIHGGGYEGYLYTIESPKYPAYRIYYTPVG
jgi:hypothetical protein